ncbi:MAG: acyl-CoA dehydrogenase family protein [Pseudomonadota bacterium]
MTIPHQPAWMDADLQTYRDMVRRFVQEKVAAHEDRWRAQQHVDRELWREAGALGVLLADVPEAYGGSGGHYGHMAVLFEELAYAGDSAFGVHVHAIAAHYLLRHGTDGQKHRYLPLLASGEMVGAIAMSEPNAGSDLQGVRTTALRDGDDYVLNGSKIFISNGYLADLIVVVAKTDTGAGAKGVSLLLLETKNAPGFTVGRILEKLGQKGQDTCELFFDEVRVPAANLLGGVEGQGFYQLMQELPYERTILANISIGRIERALDLTVQYTKERKAFGRAVFDMQNTRFKLAEVKAQTVVARTFTDSCVERLINGTMDTVTASIAKLWLSELECKVIDECVQFFGGYGYMLEYPITQLYADARVQRIYGGTSEIMKEIIARSL